jgi:hypothetical protein
MAGGYRGREVVATVGRQIWGAFARVAAAGLASLTGPVLVRPVHGRPPSGVCQPALGEPGSAELLFATQC